MVERLDRMGDLAAQAAIRRQRASVAFVIEAFGERMTRFEHAKDRSIEICSGAHASHKPPCRPHKVSTKPWVCRQFTTCKSWFSEALQASAISAVRKVLLRLGAQAISTRAARLVFVVK
jgi:hypothetical protein